MKYTVKGDLKITYFVGVEMTVDASSEEEAMHKVAHAKKDDVDTEPEHYLYEMEWQGDSPVIKEDP